MVNRVRKIIYVCTGNTCRSPLAEAITKGKLSDVEVISRGVAVFMEEPANQKTLEVVRQNGLPSLDTHVATSFNNEEVTGDTIILTMTYRHKEILKSLYPDINYVFTLKEFIGEEGDIMDPFGQDLSVYEQCYLELSRIIEQIINKIKQEE